MFLFNFILLHVVAVRFLPNRRGNFCPTVSRRQGLKIAQLSRKTAELATGHVRTDVTNLWKHLLG